MNFYENMLYLLKEKNTTQAEMSREIGLTKSACSHWKDGSVPSADIAVKVAQYLGCTVEYLITGEELSLSPDDVSLINRINALSPELRNVLIHNLESFEEIQKKLQK